MEKVLLSGLDTFVGHVLERLSCAPTKERAVVLALAGNLGAGKTTFTQALAHALGVVGVVQSPTYVLMKSYPISPLSGRLTCTTLVHIDAYRLNAPEEFAALRPEEFLNNPRNLVVVEWPERLDGMLPVPDLVLNFSSDIPASQPGGETGNVGDDSRYIEVV